MEANNPNATRHSARRAALGLGAVAGLIAVVGVAVSLAHHPGTSVVQAPLTSIAPNPTPVVTGPITGLGFSVAYDAAAHQIVVFGGVDSAGQTLVWDGGRWTRASPRTSPPGRSGAVAAYDPSSRLVMLFGGSLEPVRSANDTWAWNGATWRELNNGVAGPPPGQGAQMAWDSVRNQMVLVTDAETASGGETWTWDGSRWTRQTQGDLGVSVSGDVMAYDPISHALLLVSPAAPDDGTSLTLGWNGSSWRLLFGNGPEVEGMTLDPESDALLGCGIATYSASLEVQATCWQWTGVTWLPLPTTVPPAASEQVMVEAEVTDMDDAQTLMLGWLIRAIPGQPQPLHVWTWSGTVWTFLG